MEYKVLIKLYVPEIEKDYELYIPVNKTVSQVILLLNKVVNNLSFGVYPIKKNITLINRRTNDVYDNAKIIREVNIKNGSELILY